MVIRGVVVGVEAEATAVGVRGEGDAAAAAADEGVLQAPIHWRSRTSSSSVRGVVALGYGRRRRRSEWEWWWRSSKCIGHLREDEIQRKTERDN